MAPRKKVVSLLDVCIKALENAVTKICKNLVYESSDPPACVPMVETIKILLQGQLFPPHQDDYAEICLLALMALYQDDFIGPLTREAFDKREEVGGLLLSEFIRMKPSSLDISKWYRHTQAKIIQQLPMMRVLKIFNKTEPLSKENKKLGCNKVLVAGPLWTHLTSFTMWCDCTNKMISLISQNCPLVRKLDIAISNRVTDRSVQSLKNFRCLETIILSETSISPSGLTRFLQGSKSLNLICVECRMSASGESSIFCEALCMMHWGVLWDANEAPPERVEPLPTIQVQRIVCGIFIKKGLELLSKYFPNLNELGTEFMYEAPNLDCLLGLKKLKKLGLGFACRSPNLVLNAISVIGSLLTFLEMEISFEEQLLLNRSFDIISTSCPNIESLSFSQDEVFLVNYNPIFRPELEFRKPFQRLRKLAWRNCLQKSYIAFILNYAYNIETIIFEVHDLDTEYITDEFFESVLVMNPLTQLRRLDSYYTDSYHLSTRMLTRLVSDCENLSFMNCSLESNNIQVLKAFIKENNYDVKVPGLVAIEWSTMIRRMIQHPAGF